MPDERRRVTLTKVQCESPAGRDLIALLTELSSDGVVSRDELQRLRAWLEVDRGVDFPALPFLYEVIEQISSDGEITEDELDQLALAIERVLPNLRTFVILRQRSENRHRKRDGPLNARRHDRRCSRNGRRSERSGPRRWRAGESSTKLISRSGARSVSRNVELPASG
jgi:hypothetical protein